MPVIQVFSGGIKFLKDHLFRNFQERVPQHAYEISFTDSIAINNRDNSKLKKSFKQIVFIFYTLYNPTPDTILLLSKSGTICFNTVNIML
jgi:hypothetical protein